MEFNYSRLSGRIVEKYGTHTAFAKAMGYTKQTFSLKMNNKVRFTSDDIVKAVDLLDILPEEIGVYFFTFKV